MPFCLKWSLTDSHSFLDIQYTIPLLFMYFDLINSIILSNAIWLLDFHSTFFFKYLRFSILSVNFFKLN